MNENKERTRKTKNKIGWPIRQKYYFYWLQILFSFHDNMLKWDGIVLVIKGNLIVKCLAFEIIKMSHLCDKDLIKIFDTFIFYVQQDLKLIINFERSILYEHFLKQKK